ncbi:MAG: DNA methyltransferase [Planctomycetota bacterium]
MSQTAAANDAAHDNSVRPGAIHQGDCLELLRGLEAESVDLAFADPPFNIGFKYDQYQDDHDDEVYVAWCCDWMSELYRVLKPTGSFWLAIGDEFAADLRVKAHREIGFTPRNWVVWYYTFGQNCTRKFNRSHVHLFHFVKDEERHTFNAQDPLVRVPSARALVYGDRRANPTGRLPDDTWILRPQDMREDPEAFQRMDDTWYFSRVAGTFKERQGFHGCQMPEQLLGRIVRVSSDPGGLVLDPFSGSGTTLAVAKKLGRNWLGFDLSVDYVAYANERVANAREGDPLNGPADPVGSAPTTAAGRRLKDHPLLPTFTPEDFTPDGSEAGTGSSHRSERADGSRADRSPAPSPQPPAPVGAGPVAAGPVATAPVAPAASLREMQQEALIAALLAAHDGHSIDWLLCDPSLQDAFHERCREAGLIGRAGDWNRELLKLRKAGRLKQALAGVDMKKVTITDAEADAFAFAAEIAWAELGRKFPEWSLDALFCSPGKAFLFDRTATKYLGDAAPAGRVRWAALRLRKARKALADEAKQFHYVFKTRDFERFQAWPRMRFSRLDGQPGVYLLRTRGKDAIYLGETDNLGRRLADHAAARAPGKAIAQVSVIPSDALPSGDYRQPLWRHLVGRYQPKLNAPVVAPTV